MWLIDKIWRAIDSEGLWVFQGIMGLAFIACGVAGIFVAHGALPLTLLGSMGGLDAILWYTLLVVGPVSSLLGRSVRNTQLAYGGMWFTLTGDLTLLPALAAYLAGTLISEPFSHGGFGAYIAIALLTSSVLHVIRDLRRIQQVKRRAKL